ncbi:hypothetical protein AVEN_263947-1 [Araneus ventricosus]|uniref:Uncharacterized protein n=1 Tax=Araneus ventricosus TaxID=182803 RepID=A0A4Y2HP77_ARAVE|nr:hypothetical protein AVEN_263947-1 [Araneus ventricosus]
MSDRKGTNCNLHCLQTNSNSLLKFVLSRSEHDESPKLVTTNTPFLKNSYRKRGIMMRDRICLRDHNDAYVFNEYYLLWSRLSRQQDSEDARRLIKLQVCLNMMDDVHAEVGTNPVDTVDNGDPQEADKVEIEALMEKALDSEKAFNALIATWGLKQANKTS